MKDEKSQEMKNSPTEEAKAERLGCWFAYQHLGLSKRDIRRMKTDFIGWFRDGRSILYVQFYDPAFHQPLPSGAFEGMEGGFPTYFTVSVEVENWAVVDHYESPE